MESLPNHWDELAKILATIDINHLATQHLESCNYKILGYWDSNNKFYEEIALIHSDRINAGVVAAISRSI